MKRSPYNQTNTSFIDILRIKWLVFLMRSSFFRTTRPIIDQRPVDKKAFQIEIKDLVTMDINPSWIKGLGKNP